MNVVVCFKFLNGGSEMLVLIVDAWLEFPIGGCQILILNVVVCFSVLNGGREILVFNVDVWLDVR